jgi:hypothetical protein
MFRAVWKFAFLFVMGLALISCTPGLAAAQTATASVGTRTVVPPEDITPTSSHGLRLMVVGCSMGVDVRHGMGEVTNAYINLLNEGTTGITNVCVTLNGSDEKRPHPNKTVCMDNLPPGYEVTHRLTIDSTFQNDTQITINVTSAGTSIFNSTYSCKQIQADLLNKVKDRLGELRFRNK